MDTLVLHNDTLRLEFSRENGTLTRLTARAGAGPDEWILQDRPQVGLNFRLLVPLSERRDNPVFGERQPLASLETADDGRSATFVWEQVRSEYGGAHDIRVTLRVALDARQAVYSMTIENQSEQVIESVYCPYLGDARPPSTDTPFQLFTMFYATALRQYLWPTFQNTKGYWGVDYPTQLSGPMNSNPNAPFTLLAGERRGLYLGLAAPQLDTVAWGAELRPGFDTALHTSSLPGLSGGQAPTPDTIGDREITTRVAAIQTPFIQPGETRALAPIALEAYTGDWQAGADIYRRERDAWGLDEPARPAWVESPHSWQQLHINSPEDELRMPFRELAQVGKACAHAGVAAIQLVGWNAGGQDAGNPSHDPDPRLGTPDELKEAIAAVQAMGVKVILFAKFIWADQQTDWYRDELRRYAIKDPAGEVYQHPGYQYQTATQLLDINTRRFAPMCFLSEDYLRICEREFAKLLDLGADGMLFDECLHHGPALVCFDTTHGHASGAPVYRNDLELIRRFRRQAAARGREFLFAGEACYDAQFAVYDFSYHRSEDVNHLPATRYLRPQAPLMTAVTGFNDRNMVNQCLLYRYVISYEPYFFKGRLDDMPLTVAYGRRMDALRTELRAYFWDGEYRDTQGAEVTTVAGARYHPFAVYTSRATGQQALAVANYTDQPVELTARLTSGQPLTRFRLVDDDAWRDLAGGLRLPPRSAAVVLP